MDSYQQILRQYWGYEDFRGIQRDIIDSITRGHDTLGLMPTGGGKSITFQVPALAMEGVCIVITPLIALMKDQVQHLRERNIRAAAIYSGMSRQEQLVALDNSIFGGVKILYISPERLSSELFQKKLSHMKVSFITVDEAHCISQWGYDFRPAYLQIVKIRQLLPATPVLALTATATPRVVDDLCRQLTPAEGPVSVASATHNFHVFKMSFERPNLAYVVRHTEDKMGELIHILRSVEGCAIVYTRSRKRTKEVADYLNEQFPVPEKNTYKQTATFFHAGLDMAVKDDRQQAWQRGDVRVICATNAFGMGIDKPDVRLVIHIDCPDSIEAYFQEAGRAGRDGRKSYAVLLFRTADTATLKKRVAENYPPKEYIREVYEHLAYYFQIGINSGRGFTSEFNIETFCRTFKHFPTVCSSALRLLDQAGYIHYETDPDSKARVFFLLTRNELYRLHECSAHEEAVITALLRCYGGLFTDYVYIEETLIARECGLDREQVYLCLRSLSARHILHFIPQRKSPFISYLKDRCEPSYVQLSKDIYENRKKMFEQHVNAIICYATNEGVCRSRMLIDYFGEEHSHDCGQCDVCVEDKDSTTKEQIQEAQQAILDILSDHKPHHAGELRNIDLPRKRVSKALYLLLHEEKIKVDEAQQLIL